MHGVISVYRLLSFAQRCAAVTASPAQEYDVFGLSVFNLSPWGQIENGSGFQRDHIPLAGGGGDSVPPCGE